MDATFIKLNYKGQKEIFILNAPHSFKDNVESMTEFATIKNEVVKTDEIEFAIAFATRQSEINEFVQQIAPKLKGDAIFWVSYPKGTSKNHTCDFNRDTGWAIMGEYDLEGVRQVAIDDDWSALRFRKVEYIKTLARKFELLSEKGKIKAGKVKK